MDYRKYKLYRLAIVAALAATVGFFVNVGNYVIPLLAFVIACGLMYFLKKGVKDTLSDERIEKIAGKAARMTYSISALALALTGMVLISARGDYLAYMDIGYALEYVVCGMMLIYLVVYTYYDKRGD